MPHRACGGLRKGSEAESSTWNVPGLATVDKVKFAMNSHRRPAKSRPSPEVPRETIVDRALGETVCDVTRENPGAGIVPRGTRSLCLTCLPNK
jgi:hypothetical protein